jgi:hypothetical protein
MRSMIDNNINVATLKRTAPPEGWDTAEAQPKEVKESVAAVAPVPQRAEPGRFYRADCRMR